MAQFYEVTSVEAVAKSTVLYTLRCNYANQALAFQPGQYALVDFQHTNDQTETAAYYSIVSSPTNPSTLRFLVRIHGADTSVVNQYVRQGDTIAVDGPYGDFIFDADRDQAAVFIAEDASIAPFMSMIEYALRSKLQNEIILFYSCRNQDNIAFMRELLAIEQMNPHFHVIFAIEEGPIDRLSGCYAVEGPVSIGMIGHVIQSAFSVYSFFVSGSSGFVQQFHSPLLQAGARQDYMFYETFDQTAEQAAHKASYTGSRVSNLVNKMKPSNLTLRTRLATAAAMCLLIGVGFVLLRDPSVPQEAALANANTVTQQTAQNVMKPNGYAPTITFTADKSAIASGEKVELMWEAAGTLPRCTASGGWQGAVASNGKQQLAPAATTTYTLTCDNSSGTQTKSVTVSVKTGAPDITFTVTPNSTTPGSPVTLAWNVTGPSPNCTASAGWNGPKPPTGTLTDKPSTSTTYTLSCVNPSGTQTKSVAVAVTSAPPSTSTPVVAPPARTPGIAPPTIELTAGSTNIPIGTTTDLTWSSTGTTATSCKAGDGWAHRGNLAPNGTLNTGPVFRTTTYSITCSNAAGSYTKSVTITAY
jgi:ferredoxin-NADP reductase